MAKIEYKMDASAVLAAFADLRARAPEVVREALYQEATELIADSQDLVPRDTGTLAASSFIRFVDDPRTPVVEAGYGGAASAYALKVHENPRSGKTGGVSPSGQRYKHWAAVGQWKYLEQPFKQRAPGFSDRMAEVIRRILLRGG